MTWDTIIAGYFLLAFAAAHVWWSFMPHTESKETTFWNDERIAWTHMLRDRWLGAIGIAWASPYVIPGAFFAWLAHRKGMVKFLRTEGWLQLYEVQPGNAIDRDWRRSGANYLAFGNTVFLQKGCDQAVHIGGETMRHVWQQMTFGPLLPVLNLLLLPLRIASGRGIHDDVFSFAGDRLMSANEMTQFYPVTCEGCRPGLPEDVFECLGYMLARWDLTGDVDILLSDLPLSIKHAIAHNSEDQWVEFIHDLLPPDHDLQTEDAELFLRAVHKHVLEALGKNEGHTWQLYEPDSEPNPPVPIDVQVMGIERLCNVIDIAWWEPKHPLPPSEAVKLLSTSESMTLSRMACDDFIVEMVTRAGTDLLRYAPDDTWLEELYRLDQERLKQHEILGPIVQFEQGHHSTEFVVDKNCEAVLVELSRKGVSGLSLGELHERLQDSMSLEALQAVVAELTEQGELYRGVQFGPASGAVYRIDTTAQYWNSEAWERVYEAEYKEAFLQSQAGE